MSYSPSMVKAQILYQNVFRLATPTYSGLEVAGFEAANAYDWRDFSLFTPATAAVLEVTIPATEIDSSCVWWQDDFVAGDPNAVVVVEAWTGAAWVAFTTHNKNSGDNASWRDASAALTATKVRCTFTGTDNIRQITVGKRLLFPMGQWKSIAPPKLLHGVVVENVISVNGSILGRNLRRIVKSGDIKLNYLSQTWVRDSWNPFAIHASRYAFFWRWNPVSYPTEVGFCVADKIEAPTNSSPPPLMEVSMPLLYLG